MEFPLVAAESLPEKETTAEGIACDNAECGVHKLCRLTHPQGDTCHFQCDCPVGRVCNAIGITVDLNSLGYKNELCEVDVRSFDTIEH